MISKRLLKEIKKTLSLCYWKNPIELKEKIENVVSVCKIKIDDIIVTGETKNLVVYILKGNKILVYTPFQRLKENPVLKQISFFRSLNKKLVVLSKRGELKDILSLPKVVLINPYIVKKYPIPRLPLSVSILASYLRKYQKAHVWILDTQLGLKIRDVEKRILEIEPEIIGVSCPHGQTSLVIKILDRIYELKNKKKWRGIVIIGNFIAASFPEYFLERYPGIIIAKGEGENTMIDVVDFVKGRKRLEEISGIIVKKNNKVITTPLKPVDMNDLPPPAFDTIEKLVELRGALTHEWNRGCFWQCSFCPRHHKLKYFKGMSPRTIISQLKYFNDLLNKFPQLSRHLYVADEETIGGTQESETKRLVKIAEGIIKNNIQISFDAYTRIDQIYNLRKNKKWHVERMKMWYLLKKAGLARLFVGVESGSRTQLMRYGKGITPAQSVMAIRLLSCMGIDFRLGFIMFDPLMNLQELIENILFLERDDVLMKSVNLEEYSFSELFDLLHDKRFIDENKVGVPLCTRVSYMLAQLEVLVGCNYVNLIKAAEKKYKKKLIIGKPNMNIGKIKVRYLDSRIGLLAHLSQEWIDRNFEVMYAIKGLYKTAQQEEKVRLFEIMKTYRKLSLDFIKSMVLVIIKDKNLVRTPAIIEKLGYKREIDKLLEERSLKEGLKRCLVIFLKIMEKEIVDTTLDFLYNGCLSDTKGKRLEKALSRWKLHNSISKIIAE